MKITVEFDAGADTCAIKPGVFCRFVTTSHYGQRWHCRLFNEPLHDTPTGWLKRLAACKDATTKETGND